MCLCFKPQLLFPQIAQDVVEPNDEAAWEEPWLGNLVRHYRERSSYVRFWEVANEPDIGEDEGLPHIDSRPKTINIIISTPWLSFYAAIHKLVWEGRHWPVGTHPSCLRCLSSAQPIRRRCTSYPGTLIPAIPRSFRSHYRQLCITCRGIFMA